MFENVSRQEAKLDELYAEPVIQENHLSGYNLCYFGLDHNSSIPHPLTANHCWSFRNTSLHKRFLYLKFL